MIKLEIVESDFGTVTILKRKLTGSILYEQGDFCQSEADSNGISLASYIHAIFGLISQTEARKILLLGCGGGTLATMLERMGCAVTMIDVNAASFSLAKQHFYLPDSIVCQVSDAKSFLLSDTHSYDAIIHDAFQGDRIPVHLRSLRFFCLVRDRLARRGTFFVNVHVKNNFDDYADGIADGMKNVFSDVRLLDLVGVGERNAIVMAGAVSNLHPPNIILSPTVDRNMIEAELAAMAFRALRTGR